MSENRTDQALAAPCPSCIRALNRGEIRAEGVQPLPEKTPPIDYEGNPWCHDCSAASTVERITGVTWGMARTTVGNDRGEKLRIPGVQMGIPFVRPNKPGDLERHFDWLIASGLRSEEF